ncbi:MAG: hypothetical protein AAF752_13840 [Bacteroidota bacterium]
MQPTLDPSTLLAGLRPAAAVEHLGAPVIGIGLLVDLVILAVVVLLVLLST